MDSRLPRRTRTSDARATAEYSRGARAPLRRRRRSRRSPTSAGETARRPIGLGSERPAPAAADAGAALHRADGRRPRAAWRWSRWRRRSASGASQFVDYRAVEIGAADYRGVDAIAPAPELEPRLAAVRPRRLGVRDRRRRVARARPRVWPEPGASPACWSSSGAVVAIASCVDVPQGLREGTVGVDYQGAKAVLLGGRSGSSSASGVTPVVVGPLLAAQLRASGRARRASTVAPRARRCRVASPPRRAWRKPGGRRVSTDRPLERQARGAPSGSCRSPASPRPLVLVGLGAHDDLPVRPSRRGEGSVGPSGRRPPPLRASPARDLRRRRDDRRGASPAPSRPPSRSRSRA